MHKEILNKRYVIKALENTEKRPVELAHPEVMKPHPLSYLELPYDPEYHLYNNRMSPETLNNVSPDEQYWAVRQKVILRNTGEFPVEISGPEAQDFSNYIFASKNIFKYKPGRCSYQFACFHNGGMITDGVMLHLADNKLWMSQADGDLINWYMSHSINFDVEITDPNVWVSQIQGPNSFLLLEELVDKDFPSPWQYFDIAEVIICGEPVIITRTGFTSELGWEIYFRPENNCELIGNKIIEVGKKFDLMLTATPSFRARRIEAGLLSAGNDFNKNTNPFEVGLGRFVDLDKGDFIGKDALIKADKSSKLFGMRVDGGIAKKGRTIFIDKKNVGSVTSSSWSPFQKCGVSIVRMDNKDFVPGTIIDVISNDGSVKNAELCKLPMYDEKGEIVRGFNRTIPKSPKPWKN